MESKTVRPRAMDIQSRFFEALDMLIKSGRIRGLATFCAQYGLHRAKYSNIKNHITAPEEGTGYKFIDVDALAYLVEDFNVSADWLITGRGGMFRK